MSVSGPLALSVLQLVAVTSLWIACKQEECVPPFANELAHITRGACSVEMIVNMEREMAQSLKWNMLPYTVHSFLSYFMYRLFCNSVVEMYSVPLKHWKRVMELVDFATLDEKSMTFLPSVLAATAIIVYVKNEQRDMCTMADIENVTGYPEWELAACINWFSFELQPVTHSKVRYRYNHGNTNEPGLVQLHNHNALCLYKQQYMEKKYPVASC